MLKSKQTFVCCRCADTLEKIGPFLKNEWITFCLHFVDKGAMRLHLSKYGTIIRFLEDRGYITTKDDDTDFLQVVPRGYHEPKKDMHAFCIAFDAHWEEVEQEKSEYKRKE
jgi:hypothetical protein